MPGPGRLVRRSVVAGMQRGWTHQLAAERVLTAVLIFRTMIAAEAGPFAGWLEQLESEARRLAGSPPPHDPQERTVSHGGTTTAG